MPCAAHVRGPSIRRALPPGPQRQPRARPASDAALLRAIPPDAPRARDRRPHDRPKAAQLPRPAPRGGARGVRGRGDPLGVLGCPHDQHANAHQPRPRARRAALKDDQTRRPSRPQRGASLAESARATRRCTARRAGCLRTPNSGARGGDRGAMRRSARVRPRRMPPPSPREDDGENESEGTRRRTRGGRRVGRGGGSSSSGATDNENRFVFPPSALPPRNPPPPPPPPPQSAPPPAPLTFDEILPSAFDLCTGSSVVPQAVGQRRSHVDGFRGDARLSRGFARATSARARRVLGPGRPERERSRSEGEPARGVAAGSGGARGAGAAGGGFGSPRGPEDSDEGGSSPSLATPTPPPIQNRNRTRTRARTRVPADDEGGATKVIENNPLGVGSEGAASPPRSGPRSSGQALDLPFPQTSGAKALRRSMLTRAFNDVRGPFRLVSATSRWARTSPRGGGRRGTSTPTITSPRCTVRSGGGGFEPRAGTTERGAGRRRAVGRGDRHARSPLRAVGRRGGTRARRGRFAGPKMVVGIWARRADFRRARGARGARAAPFDGRDRGAGARDAIYVPPGRWHAVQVEDAEVPDPGPERSRDGDSSVQTAFPCVFRRAECATVGLVVLRGDARRSRRACACWPTSTTAPATTRRATTCSEAFSLRGWERASTKTTTPGSTFAGCRSSGAGKGFDLAAEVLSRRASHRQVSRLLLVVDDDERLPLCAACGWSTTGGSRAGVRSTRCVRSAWQTATLGSSDSAAAATIRSGAAASGATSTLTDRDYCRSRSCAPR